MPSISDESGLEFQAIPAKSHTDTDRDLENAPNTTAAVLGTAVPTRFLARLKRINRMFACVVVVPTVLSTIYFGVIASDVYVSESRFVVRSTKQQARLSVVGALMSGSGLSQADENTYPVIDYIESRDALRELNRGDYIAKAYASNGDFISRFHRRFDPSFEALWRYYGKHVVNVSADPTSGIAVLQVRAFDAADAAQINTRLLGLGEQLINRMNERAANDTVEFAQREVDSAGLKVKRAASALAAYRNRYGLFDPDRQSALRLQQVTALQTELFADQSQLTQLLALAPQNPQVAALRTAIAALQKQIDELTGTVAGTKNSLSQRAAEYQQLQLDAQFSEKQLASALASFETAREEAAHKQLYLEAVVQPNTPDIAIEPKRVRSIVTTFVFCVVLWAVLVLLIASIKEHRD